MAEPGSCDDIGCTVYRPQDFVDGPPRPMSREPGRPVVIAGLVLVAFVLGLVSAAPAGARPQAHARHLTRSFRDRSMSRARTRTITPARPLVFGIYPGGAAGTVGPAGQLQPEDPVKRLAALEQLRPPGAPFVLHLYAGYTGAGGYSAQQQVGDQIDAYAAAGFEIELVLTYRPADGGSAADVGGFVSYVRTAVAAFGPNPGFVSLQVTNEANVTNAPDAADGYYKGAEDALIDGVIAAKQQIVESGWSQVEVGFNWANSSDSGEAAFWRYLAVRGGEPFVSAVDWVGLDAYPGTWGPATGGSLAVATARAMATALATLRDRYLPLAGIPRGVALHISENGYPTGTGRTEKMQVEAMRAAIGAVEANRSRYNITDYRWFDLRDADSASGSFEDQYGLMTDDYTPKLGFDVYRELVAAYSYPSSSAARAVRRQAIRLESRGRRRKA